MAEISNQSVGFVRLPDPSLLKPFLVFSLLDIELNGRGYR